MNNRQNTFKKISIEDISNTANINHNSNVLEMGFDSSAYSEAIQNLSPHSHTITTDDNTNPVLLSLMTRHPKIKILDNSNNPTIFNTIIVHKPFVEIAKKHLEHFREELNNTQQMLNQTLIQLQDIKFSDRDIDEFIEGLSQRDDYSTLDIVDFSTRLVEQGNITQKQQIMLLETIEKKGLNIQSSNTPNSLTNLINTYLGNQISDQSEIFTSFDISDNDIKALDIAFSKLL